MTTVASGGAGLPDGDVRGRPPAPVYAASCMPEAILKLRSQIADIADPSCRFQASVFCDALESAMEERGLDMTADPMYFTQEDDEAYFEWIFDYYRFGFCFFADGVNSSWLFSGMEEGDLVSTGSWRMFDRQAHIADFVVEYIGRMGNGQ